MLAGAGSRGRSGTGGRRAQGGDRLLRPHLPAARDRRRHAPQLCGACDTDVPVVDAGRRPSARPLGLPGGDPFRAPADGMRGCGRRGRVRGRPLARPRLDPRDALGRVGAGRPSRPPDPPRGGDHPHPARPGGHDRARARGGADPCDRLLAHVARPPRRRRGSCQEHDRGRTQERPVRRLPRAHEAEAEPALGRHRPRGLFRGQARSRPRPRRLPGARSLARGRGRRSPEPVDGVRHRRPHEPDGAAAHPDGQDRHGLRVRPRLGRCASSP